LDLIRVRTCLFLYLVLTNMSVLLGHKKGKKGKPSCHGRFHELDALHRVRLIPQLRGHGVRPLKKYTKNLEKPRIFTKYKKNNIRKTHYVVNIQGSSQPYEAVLTRTSLSNVCGLVCLLHDGTTKEFFEKKKATEEFLKKKGEIVTRAAHIARQLSNASGLLHLQ
jgi:hypothetical protein